jgi:hypothetical protein
LSASSYSRAPRSNDFSSRLVVAIIRIKGGVRDIRDLGLDRNFRDVKDVRIIIIGNVGVISRAIREATRPFRLLTKCNNKCLDIIKLSL